MTFASDILPDLSAIRAIPGELGLRPHRVYLRTKEVFGQFGSSFAARTDIEITEGNGQPPKVTQLNDEQLALASIPQGSFEIGPITTPREDLGITSDQLRGVGLDTYDTLLIRLVGPTGDNLYRIQKLTMDKALHWKLTVVPHVPTGTHG